MKRLVLLMLILQGPFLWAQQDRLHGMVDYAASRNNAYVSQVTMKRLVFTPSHSVFFYSPDDTIVTA